MYSRATQEPPRTMRLSVLRSEESSSLHELKCDRCKDQSPESRPALYQLACNARRWLGAEVILDPKGKGTHQNRHARARAQERTSPSACYSCSVEPRRGSVKEKLELRIRNKTAMESNRENRTRVTEPRRTGKGVKRVRGDRTLSL